MAGRPLPASKLRARRRKRRLILAAVIAVLVVLLLGAGVGLSWLPWVRIQTIQVSGNTAVSSQSIEDDARDVLKGGYLHLFARDNIMLYPREEIRLRLLRDFPNLSQAIIGGENLTTLKIVVSERKAQALWCGPSVSLPGACYLLDGGGAAFAPAADFGGDIYTEYYGPVSSSSPQQFLAPDAYRALAATVGALKTKIADDTLAAVAVEGDEVAMHFASGFELRFSLADSGADVLDRFSLALTAAPFAARRLSDFDYLDLRFGDKLYYKLKNE
jgi:hypothetical protein